MKSLKKRFGNLFKRIRLIKNWPLFMWPFGNYGQWPREVKLRSGGKILISSYRSSDMAIFNEVAIDDVYELANVQNPKKILDIGSNIGIFSIVVAQKFPNATIIAFEPEKNNFKALQANILRSKAKNITAINKAVSDNATVANLYISQANPGSHSLFGKGEHQTIETVSLEDFLPADFIKIDAEGAEYAIFKNKIPDCQQISMELHEGEKDRLLGKFSDKYSVSNPSADIFIFRHKT